MDNNNNAPEELFYSSSDAAKNVDHFIIDDLLDFPNDADDASAGISSPPVDTSSNSSSGLPNFHAPDLAAHFSTDQFCVPYDDLAELEWLSNFEEESFSSDDLQKLQLIQGIPTRPDVSVRSRPMLRPEVSVPARARSKRSRPAPGSWTSRLLAVAPPPPPTPAAAVPERRCLHCATDRTPQWRTGPMGPKTLCNACGVRFKSGRLVPEYRPASSPTFVLAKHSNSHRKVLELRRQKETSTTKAQQHQFMSHHHQMQQQQQQQQQVFDVSNGEDYLIHHHIGPGYLV